jgi:hypothetical protein
MTSGNTYTSEGVAVKATVSGANHARRRAAVQAAYPFIFACWSVICFHSASLSCVDFCSESAFFLADW